eukprot:m.6695 g.6695  ORF g.6695 m.6695 type:complete len:62 (+) comp5344_c0_seq1:247-432(+)
MIIRVVSEYGLDLGMYHGRMIIVYVVQGVFRDTVLVRTSHSQLESVYTEHDKYEFESLPGY